jgi:hypothetical protein
MIGSLIATVVLGGLAVALIGLYLLPVLLAWARHVPDIGAIAVINILLGWTLAGWVVALALALRSDVRPSPAIQLVQHLPPSPLPPGSDWAGPPAPPWRRPASAPPLRLPPIPQQPEDPAEDGEQQWPAQP